MRKIHLKESIVESRILTKTVRTPRELTGKPQNSKARRADRTLERESQGHILLPPQPSLPVVRMGCLLELSLFISLGCLTMWHKLCGLKQEDCIVL